MPKPSSRGITEAPPAPSKLRRRKERAAAGPGRKGDVPNAPHTAGKCAKSPSSNILTAARTPVLGMAGDPRLLFQAKSLPIPAIRGHDALIAASPRDTPRNA